MSKIKEYAKFYTKFWYRNAAGVQMLAHNAPSKLRDFLRENNITDEQLAYEVFIGLATGTLPEDKTVPELLQWFSLNPQATTRCDEVLQQKQRVSSFVHLLNKAYGLERSQITDSAHKFLVGLTT